MRCFILNWLATPRYLVHHGPLLGHRLGEASHLLSSNECNLCTICTTIVKDWKLLNSFRLLMNYRHKWWWKTMMNRGGWQALHFVIIFQYRIRRRWPTQFHLRESIAISSNIAVLIQPKGHPTTLSTKTSKLQKTTSPIPRKNRVESPPSLRAFRSPSIISNLLHGIF